MSFSLHFRSLTQLTSTIQFGEIIPEGKTLRFILIYIYIYADRHSSRDTYDDKQLLFKSDNPPLEALLN